MNLRCIMEKSKIFEIPQVKNTVGYYVNGKYMGDITDDQLNVIRVRMIKYIQDTGDESILKDVYFIGHESSDGARSIGDELKFTVEDKNGNLSDYPWELDHVRRSMYTLISITNPNKDEDTRNEIYNNYIKAEVI